MKKLWRWSPLSLKQTLLLGAGAGILLPALVLAYLQISHRFVSEVQLRVRAPMQQYADVLARGLGVAIWNVDKGVGSELVAAVMRNPDVLSVTVSDEFGEEFLQQFSPLQPTGIVMREERDVFYNNARIGHLAVAMTSARIERDLRNSLLELGMALLAQVGISFAVIWLLLDRRLLRPLRELQEGALRLARGQLDQPLSWIRGDEMGSLANGLDKMRIDLNTLLRERDQKTAALEYELVERQRAQAELSVSQAKFSAIFDASPVAMSVSSMSGTLAVLDVNSAWVRVFARTRESVLGTTGTDNGIWINHHLRRAAMEELQNTGELRGCEAWCGRGGGLPDILCEISGKVLVLGDESLLILAFEDITARHHYDESILLLNSTLEQRVLDRTQELSDALHRLTAAQDELVRSEKMAALGSLVAGVAHELNTPIGNSLVVASTLQDQSREFAAELVQGIKRSQLDNFVRSTQDGAHILMRGLRHAADLISSFKQVAVDQTSVNRRRFALGATVNEILLTLGPGIRKTTHSVQCDIPDDITMESYPGPLGQVITNLVNNALLHAFDERSHGKVFIAAYLQGPTQVGITVRDDGAGIPEANLARVFDPFFTTKLGKGGSGLGLNIVYNLVRDVLGGLIQVSSPPGEGACFTLVLPLVAPEGRKS